LAVAVVTPDKAPIEGVNGTIQGFVNFLGSAWPYLLIGIIIIILAIVIFYLLKKLEDERKERDEPGFQLYKNVKAACDLNCDRRLIRKSFNPVMLLWLLIPPLFWLMFVFKKEHSAKIVDYQGNLFGWYRGDYVAMDNSWHFLVYKTKSWLIIEDLFVIKVPMGFDVKKVKKDENGKTLMESDGKTPQYETRRVDLREFIQKLPNGDIKLQATSIERLGIYYMCPVFIMPVTGDIVDYRKLIDGAITDNTYQLMTTRLLNMGARQMEKGMLFNPSVQANRLSPEKTKEEEKIDKFE
jgi:hypothetical protein